MEEANVDKKIRQVIAETVGITEEEVIPSLTFKDLGFDSLDLVELVMSLEEALNIDIEEDEMEEEKIQTVQQTIDYIKLIGMEFKLDRKKRT